MVPWLRLLALSTLVSVAVESAIPQWLANPLLSSPPKREFRAAWIATVANLDWPTSSSDPPSVQQNQLIGILDNLKAAGIRAVVFQVRPECDALYNSLYEPWSYYLTGQQGLPPNPFWDPLTFAVDETHKRGMEIHAWFNPYRAVRQVGLFPISSQHVSVQHPNWILTFGTLKMLDPGLPEVREYDARVIADVVRRYDIDGIHMDDYFYPYPPNQITNQDDSTFARYPRGFTNRGDWRRDNINLLLTMMRDSVQAIKPWVKFGMSPFGIWKNGVPPGITGLDAYNTIYCDAITWLRRGIIDYLTPQLYWRIGGSQDYNILSRWWSDSVSYYRKHFYPGKIFGSYTTSELPNQVRIDRANANTAGSVFFRAQNFLSNTLGFSDSLKNDFYRYPALHPVMRWKDTIPPWMPRNIRYAPLAGSGAALQWDVPLIAPDGDSASRYVVYRFDHSPNLPQELDSARNIIAIEGRRFSVLKTPPNIGGPYYYVATALDRNYNESETSGVVALSPPASPLLVFPANGATGIAPNVAVRWTSPSLVGTYYVQVSTDSAFTGGFVVNDSTVVDTFRIVAGMNGQSRYYWRVRSSNAGGSSSFSAAWSFVTGFPAAPTLVSPPNAAVDVPLTPRLVWNRSSAATSYRLQLATSGDFTTIVTDTSGLVDTSFVTRPLQLNVIYFWRISGANLLGSSPWSSAFRFRTTLTSVDQLAGLPTEHTLAQNYPNPFNPTTTIEFALPQAGHVELKIYDVLGRETATLVDTDAGAGFYRARWDASGFASGMYFYRLVAGSFVDTKRMILMK